MTQYIIFLDGQKIRYNKLSWHYIRLVIKTSDNRVNTVSEDIVIGEGIDMYTWIFKVMISVTPH